MVKNRPITKKEVQDLQPKPFIRALAYTRFSNGQRVPQGHPAYTPPRLKRTWSFDGTHEITSKDGSKVTRPGQYVVKMKRP